MQIGTTTIDGSPPMDALAAVPASAFGGPAKAAGA
jgi:hypothetical protein